MRTEQALRENKFLLWSLSGHRFSQFAQADGPKSDPVSGEPNVRQLLGIQLHVDLGTRSCPAWKVPPAACASAEAEEHPASPRGPQLGS